MIDNKVGVFRKGFMKESGLFNGEGGGGGGRGV